MNQETQEETKVYGLIEESPGPLDYVYGGTTVLDRVVRAPDRVWLDSVPEYEAQKRYGFDTFGCVTFSKWNCKETLLKKKYGMIVNFSDRFTIVDSGTIHGIGNSLYSVAEHSRKDGFLLEDEYSWTPDVDTQSEYYKPVSKDLKEKAKQNLVKVEFLYEWVDWGGCDPEKLYEALQYAPLQVTVFAWGNPVNGMFRRHGTTETNHAVALVSAEYKQSWLIYDHYDNQFKILDWDFYFGSAMRHDVILKDANMENTFVRIVKDKNSSAVGFFIPATTPVALENMALIYNKTIHKKVDGGVDWASTIEGDVVLK